MTRADIILTLGKMKATSKEEAQAVKEAIKIILASEWMEPELDLPANTDFVLVLVSGRIGNATYDHSPTIAEYWEGEGWYLTEIDYNEQKDYWTVDAWMSIPEYEKEEE